MREEEGKAISRVQSRVISRDHARSKYAGLIAQINQTTGCPPGKAYVEMSLGKVLVPDIP